MRRGRVAGARAHRQVSVTGAIVHRLLVVLCWGENLSWILHALQLGHIAGTARAVNAPADLTTWSDGLGCAGSSSLPPGMGGWKAADAAALPFEHSRSRQRYKMRRELGRRTGAILGQTGSVSWVCVGKQKENWNNAQCNELPRDTMPQARLKSSLSPNFRLQTPCATVHCQTSDMTTYWQLVTVAITPPRSASYLLQMTFCRGSSCCTFGGWCVARPGIRGNSGMDIPPPPRFQ